MTTNKPKRRGRPPGSKNKSKVGKPEVKLARKARHGLEVNEDRKNSYTVRYRVGEIESIYSVQVSGVSSEAYALRGFHESFPNAEIIEVIGG